MPETETETAKTFEEECDALDLNTVCGGAAHELFAEELKRVIQNSLDPNTDVKGKREITLKFELVVNTERDAVHIAVQAASKLAPFAAVGGIAFIGNRRGEPVALVHDQKQLQIKWDETDKPRTVRGDGSPAKRASAQ